jgi:hypothetical protein
MSSTLRTSVRHASCRQTWLKKSPVYVRLNFPSAYEYRKCVENKARLPSALSASSSNTPQPRFESAVVNFGVQNCELLRSVIEMLGKGKAIPVQAWRPLGLREVEAPTFSNIRLTDGGKVVSPTRRPRFTLRKIPSTHFC